jgi:hypothetical protein
MQTDNTIEDTEAASKQTLTRDKLRQYPGLSELTDEQADRIITDLRVFSRILLEIKPIL